MSNILKELLDELKAGGLDKTAAPNEAPSVEQQNADILETSQAVIAKIDNFLQQAGGGEQDPNQDPQGAGAGPVSPETGGDPNNPESAGNASVHLEVPAGMSVKLASVNPVDSESALRTIIGLVPSYFGGE